MEWLADWVYGIAAVLLFGAVVLQAVPEGTYRKYVRMFLGVIMILAVTSPIVSWFGLSEQTFLHYERDLVSLWQSGLEHSGGEFVDPDAGAGGAWREEAQQRREAAYHKPLSALAEQYGFTLSSYRITWSEDGTQPVRFILTLQRKEEAGKEESVQTEGAPEMVPSVKTVGNTELAGANFDSEDGTVSYEPSELRPLHEAMEIVFELERDQVILYWDRQG